MSIQPKQTVAVIVTATCMALAGCSTLSKTPHARAWESALSGDHRQKLGQERTLTPAERKRADIDQAQTRAKQRKQEQEERKLLGRSQMTSWQLQQQTATEVAQRAAREQAEYAQERARKLEQELEQELKQAEQQRLLELARAEHERERAQKLETARAEYERTLTPAERKRKRIRAQIVERELVRVLDKGKGLETARKRASELARELARLDPKQARTMAHALSAELKVAYDLELWHLLSGRERLDYERSLELKRTLLRSRVLEGY